MATTKTFENVRLQLKYDTYTAWTTNNPVLLKGEVAITTVPTKSDGVEQVPAVLMKIGDGEHTYNELKFTSALAANVHDWALAEAKPVYAANEITGLDTFINNTIEDTNTTYQIVKVDEYNYKLQYKDLGGDWTDVGENGTVTIPKYDDTQLKADITALQTQVGTGKVEEQINAAIEALKLPETYDTKGAADEALATAKAYADGKDTAITAAASAAAAAQADVDALEAKVGDVTTGKTLVEMIEAAKTDATYDDTEVRGLITTNTNDIAAVKADYLKASDKTALQDQITSNKDAIDTLNGSGDGSVDKKINDAFNDFATKVSDDNVVNTYKELIDYAAANDSQMTTIAANIKTNADDIDAVEARATALEGKMDTAESDIDDLNATIGDVTTGKTLVEMIEAAKNDAVTSATYDDTEVRGLIKTNADDIDAVEARAAALEKSAVLEGDTLILNCGNSVIA